MGHSVYLSMQSRAIIGTVRPVTSRQKQSSKGLAVYSQRDNSVDVLFLSMGFILANNMPLNKYDVITSEYNAS
jgi:hypothetical protein